MHEGVFFDYCDPSECGNGISLQIQGFMNDLLRNLQIGTNVTGVYPLPNFSTSDTVPSRCWGAVVEITEDTPFHPAIIHPYLNYGAILLRNDKPLKDWVEYEDQSEWLLSKFSGEDAGTDALRFLLAPHPGEEDEDVRKQMFETLHLEPGAFSLNAWKSFPVYDIYAPETIGLFRMFALGSHSPRKTCAFGFAGCPIATRVLLAEYMRNPSHPDFRTMASFVISERLRNHSKVSSVFRGRGMESAFSFMTGRKKIKDAFDASASVVEQVMFSMTHDAERKRVRLFWGATPMENTTNGMIDMIDVNEMIRVTTGYLGSNKEFPVNNVINQMPQPYPSMPAWEIDPFSDVFYSREGEELTGAGCNVFMTSGFRNQSEEVDDPLSEDTDKNRQYDLFLSDVTVVGAMLNDKNIRRVGMEGNIDTHQRIWGQDVKSFSHERYIILRGLV